jgi:hypothetical protein
MDHRKEATIQGQSLRRQHNNNELDENIGRTLRRGGNGSQRIGNDPSHFPYPGEHTHANQAAQSVTGGTSMRRIQAGAVIQREGQFVGLF